MPSKAQPTELYVGVEKECLRDRRRAIMGLTALASVLAILLSLLPFALR
jgi:hypothetical protein